MMYPPSLMLMVYFQEKDAAERMLSRVAFAARINWIGFCHRGLVYSEVRQLGLHDRCVGKRTADFRDHSRFEDESFL